MIKSASTEEFLRLRIDSSIIDVRTPAEYAAGHIPGALNVPLFSNEERARVGTCYVHEGRKNAMLQALDMIGPKMRNLAEQLLSHVRNEKILVHCWRGGMRSSSIAWLVDFFGSNVVTLNGGYKSYRRFIRNFFLENREINVIGGKTGSAKTSLLHSLRNCGEQVIDLEALAQHKGSAFGSLGEEEKQPTQEQFENTLGKELYETSRDRPVWLEDESRMIGRIEIPETFFKQMRESKIIFLDTPREKRIKNLIKDYGIFESSELNLCIQKIKKRLGGLNTKRALEYLNGGQLTDTCAILLDYYDKLYEYGLSKRKIETIKKVRIENKSDDDIVNSILDAAKKT